MIPMYALESTFPLLVYRHCQGNTSYVSKCWKLTFWHIVHSTGSYLSSGMTILLVPSLSDDIIMFNLQYLLCDPCGMQYLLCAFNLHIVLRFYNAHLNTHLLLVYLWRSIVRKAGPGIRVKKYHITLMTKEAFYLGVPIVIGHVSWGGPIWDISSKGVNKTGLNGLFMPCYIEQWKAKNLLFQEMWKYLSFFERCGSPLAMNGRKLLIFGRHMLRAVWIR